MMKMTARLLVRPSMSLQISLSTLGRRSPRKAETSARVSLYQRSAALYRCINLELLEKSRHKRPGLEDVLNHPWFAEFSEIHKIRQGAADGEARFMAFTLTEPNSPKIREECERYGGGLK